MKKLYFLLFVLLFLVPGISNAYLQCLVKVPITDTIKATTTKISTLSVKSVQVFKTEKTKTQATGDMLTNTRIVNGYKLINYITKMNLAEFQKHIKDENLDWTILAANDGWTTDKDGNRIVNTLIEYDPTEVMGYMVRKKIYKEVVSDTKKLDSKSISIDTPEMEVVNEVEPDRIRLWKFAGFPDFEAKE